MAVVKADAYGHGLVPCARAALAGGATWLGVAQLAEGARPCAGPASPAGCCPGCTCRASRSPRPCCADIDLSRLAPLGARPRSAPRPRETGRTARIHLKVDTGLSRNGCQPADWPDLVAAVAAAAGRGRRSRWSASGRTWPAPTRRSTRRSQAQRELFERDGGRGRAGRRCAVQLRHLANSAATLTDPAAHFDLVRPGHRGLRALAGARPRRPRGVRADARR